MSSQHDGTSSMRTVASMPTQTMTSLLAHNTTALMKHSSTGTAGATESPKVFDGGAGRLRAVVASAVPWCVLCILGGMALVG